MPEREMGRSIARLRHPQSGGGAHPCGGAILIDTHLLAAAKADQRGHRVQPFLLQVHDANLGLRGAGRGGDERGEMAAAL